jgi:hypothetical protein
MVYPISKIQSVAISGFHRNLTKTISPYHALNVKILIGIGREVKQELEFKEKRKLR